MQAFTQCALAPDRQASSKPRRLASLPTTEPESAGLCALSPGPIVFLPRNLDDECLLANLTEALASVDAWVSDLAFELDGFRRILSVGFSS